GCCRFWRQFLAVAGEEVGFDEIPFASFRRGETFEDELRSLEEELRSLLNNARRGRRSGGRRFGGQPSGGGEG
ncbi:hypothetical protein, partial [Mesorhizobium sp.]|uniref:hypothetical protein n=1 Tax=Mesorhizobium sp. TaxID=1871066 RepID=UPI0025B98DFB